MYDMCLQVIKSGAPLTYLHMLTTGFDQVCDGQEICEALVDSGLSNFDSMRWDSNPGWFDSEAKCAAWAVFFIRQTSLREMTLCNNNISGGRKEMLKAAFPAALFTYN